MAKLKKKKRNPQDTTLRNLRALKRQVENIRLVLISTMKRVTQLERQR